VSAPVLEPQAPDGLGLRRRILEILMVAALVGATFGPSLPYYFLPSDFDWLSIGKFGSGEVESLRNFPTYRPTTGVVFDAAYSLFGEVHAWPYRLTLMVLHGANAILASTLVGRMLRRPDLRWVVAALFAVAPASSEVVHTISTFVYPLVAFFLYLGLLLYDRAVETNRWTPWIAALLCFGCAAPLREHWIAAAPLALLLEFNRGGAGAYKTRGFLIRIGTLVVAGLAFFLWRGIPAALRGPEYRFEATPMATRLLLSFERLVLPPIPLDLAEYRGVHLLAGAGVLVAALWIATRGRSTERWRAYALLAALLIALGPFLPVEGATIRQRFAYFGIPFAAGIAALGIHILGDRLSHRAALPVLGAMLAGLLMEQQAEFTRDYRPLAEESRVRAAAFRQAEQLVSQLDEVAVFDGDLEARNFAPNLQSVRSTFRVLSGVSRRQVVQIEAGSAEELTAHVDRLRAASQATGTRMRLFLRAPTEYSLVRLTESSDPAKVAFQTEESRVGPKTMFVLLPREPKL